MAAPDPTACESYYQTHSPAELREKIRDVLDALDAPESLTANSLDGVSNAWQAKSRSELMQALADLNCALKKHEPDAVPVSQVRSRFINFGTRQIE